MKVVYIISAVRTPWEASVAHWFSATQLGAIAIKGAVERAGIKPEMVNDVYMGSVIQANLGQAPAPSGQPNLQACRMM